MNCQEFESLLSSLPDAQAEAKLRAHAGQCPQCAARLAEQEALLQALSSLDDDVELPDAFSQGWRQAIRTESNVKRRSPARWVNWVAAAATVVFLFGGTAIMRMTRPATDALPNAAVYSDAADDLTRSAGVDFEAMQAPVAMAADAGGGFEPESATAQGSVLLRTASVALNSAAYEDDLAQIEALLAQSGGWAEYRSTSGEPIASNPEGGRFARLTLRVPVEAMDGFIDAVSGIGTLTRSEQSTEDVSDSYYDVQGRLKMYQAQRDRLEELLAQAQSMSDIIEIESSLNETQYAIESLQGSLNAWDSRAQNAVVYVSLTEVAEAGAYARASLGSRLSEALGDSFAAARAFFADMLVFLVMALPYLAIAAVVAVAAVLGFKIKKRRKAKE